MIVEAAIAILCFIGAAMAKDAIVTSELNQSAWSNLIGILMAWYFRLVCTRYADAVAGEQPYQKA